MAGAPQAAHADDQATSAAAPAAPAAPVIPATPVLLPALTGPLTANSKPLFYDAGPLGKIYVTGVVSGLSQWQNNVAPGDRAHQADVSNAQVFLNKTDGVVQFFIQAGTYSLPDLGSPYIRSGSATNAFYEPLSQAFIRIVPSDSVSILAGKLPTLIGAEYTFSFENMNIGRGLLWNQENAVNRGVQVNYTLGPVALSASWNDGMYSNQFSWAWLSAGWTIDKTNSLSVIAGGNTRHTSTSSLATPLYQNNEQIYNVIYTHTSGAWTVEPYFQYTHVPRVAAIGALHEAATYGAALFVSYNFDASAVARIAGFSLPVRVEYIGSTGSVADGAPNLMYGPGSKAWSFTITPTWQRGGFFARAEFSYVGARDIIPGLAFGPGGNDSNQSRVLLETGVMF
ncbi:MAG: porin [Proteobacteria bacterium]|nr:porin [Pseudomonadota bacterium]